MAKFSERLRQLRTAKGWTQSELAARVNVGSQAVSQYERGVRRPDQDTLLALCDVFNVSADYLLGKDSVFPRLVGLDEMKTLDTPHRIPVYGRVAAGDPMTMVEDITDYEEITEEMLRNGSEYFALTIHGSSMAPRMQEGDVVIVRRQPDVENGELAVVAVNGDDATCKRIRKTEDGLTLVPLNPAYEPIFYSSKQAATLPVTILGKVVELRAKF